ncbi:MAG: hypothetical protein H6811_01050 [Phycisphaeraceae bacterium]|nr:hypothetical protein [Phycisphaeraceae bacterium]
MNAIAPLQLGPLDPEDLQLVESELSRLATWRRAGVVMMYLPALGLLLAMGAFVSYKANLIQQVTMALAGLLVLFGLPLAPIGAVVRVFASRRLRRLGHDLVVVALPASPALRIGDVLGNWRVARATPSLIRLRYELVARPLGAALRFGVDGLMLGIVSVTVVSAVRLGTPSGWGVVALIAALTTLVSSSMGGGSLVIDRNSGRVAVRFSGHPVWGVVPMGGWRVERAELDGVMLGEGMLVVRTQSRGIRILRGFGVGPYGLWQLRRLAAMFVADPGRVALASGAHGEDEASRAIA